MSREQMLTLALSTVPTMTVVLIGILLNNSGLNDLKEGLRSEIRVIDERMNALQQVVRAQLEAQRSEMDKNHSEMLHRFGDLDNRLTRIESSLGMNR